MADAGSFASNNELAIGTRNM